MKHYLVWDHAGLWRTLLQAEDEQEAIRYAKEGKAIAPMVQELAAFCHQKNISEYGIEGPLPAWAAVADKQTVRYDNSAQSNNAR